GRGSGVDTIDSLPCRGGACHGRTAHLRRLLPTQAVRGLMWIVGDRPLGEVAANGRVELGDRDGALEFRLDPAVAADEEDPGLARQPPLMDPFVLALRGLVVLVDL